MASASTPSVGEGGRRGLRLRMETRRRRSDLLGDSWPEDEDCDTSAACGRPPGPAAPPGPSPLPVVVPAVAVDPLDDAPPGVLGSA